MAAEHLATIVWERTGETSDFLRGKYSREHTWSFDGGVVVPASPSPSVVRVPHSNPANVDPEEAFVAAIASCHMLTFVYLAGRAGIIVDGYQDNAVGIMTKNEKGVAWVSTVTLYPRVRYGGENAPTHAEESSLHHEAHEQCIIANSVRTEIVVVASNG
ncbi:MAG: OsmC family protein [Akkermansiaceae bacterium]|nr:OsmC family protein [Armatimonadota bacterium]